MPLQHQGRTGVELLHYLFKVSVMTSNAIVITIGVDQDHDEAVSGNR